MDTVDDNTASGEIAKRERRQMPIRRGYALDLETTRERVRQPSPTISGEAFINVISDRDGDAAYTLDMDTVDDHTARDDIAKRDRVQMAIR